MRTEDDLRLYVQNFIKEVLFLPNRDYYVAQINKLLQDYLAKKIERTVFCSELVKLKFCSIKDKDKI